MGDDVQTITAVGSGGAVSVLDLDPGVDAQVANGELSIIDEPAPVPVPTPKKAVAKKPAAEPTE